MEEENFYEQIERIRGNIEGYELKVKPKVEFLSAMFATFEEKAKRNVALALKAKSSKFEEYLNKKEGYFETAKIEVEIKNNEVSFEYLLSKYVYDYSPFVYPPFAYFFSDSDIWGGSRKKSWQEKEKLKLRRDIFIEYLILNEKESELIKWLSGILKPIEGFREIAIEGLKTYIETIYPVERIRLGKTIYCKRDFKGEDRWIPTRIQIENVPPTESGTSAIRLRIRDDVSNKWKADLYFYEPEGLVNMINELTKEIGYLFKRTSMELNL